MLQPWHDFYALTGAASATLVGSCSSPPPSEPACSRKSAKTGLRVFLSPTVVAFGAALATSLLGVVPLSDPRILAGLAAGIGALGLTYSVRVWRRLIDGGMAAEIDHEDRVWYFAAPAFAYAIMVAAGLAILLAPQAAGTLLAVALCLLLVAGIRNAWDMTTWVLLRRKE